MSITWVARFSARSSRKDRPGILKRGLRTRRSHAAREWAYSAAFAFASSPNTRANTRSTFLKW